VDLVAVAAALVPSLEALGSTAIGPVVVLTDELIGSALAPYPDLVEAIHPTRITAGSKLTNWETHGLLRAAGTDEQRMRILQEIKNRPMIIIQQTPIGTYYSPYSEINVYDKDIVNRLTTSAVNRLSPSVLKAAGFQSWQWLDARGQVIQAPTDTNSAQTGGSTAQPTYHIWKRIQPTSSTAP
jgi:hypothetical protein